ncbi:GNAT family N-acetyltransferase [Clostridium bowmanii]|uniref:GNAT family N-acetyltransferase n=1 Tax=Clostridium bowmanii TaxID=132925 RepID=UPI001C0E3716|nr:GNAT family N-acetyltransferase [Clostridium bowmanii]MBU3191860.1 GNAT family N-acetyltransferase [Clostridium bowmanii]MCA1076150.1 GNAT family N-acetyltransferase [Clostridium bowmanii]
MFSKFTSTDIVYTKKFSENYEDNEIIRSYDNNLQDMYMHNFTLIKNSICKDRFGKIILYELEKRKAENANFLRIEFNFAIENDFINNLPVIPQVTKYDYMYIDPHMGEYLTGNDECVLTKALSEKTLKKGIEVDILANQSAMGTEFTRKRIYRKSEVYKQINSNLDLYVCDYNGISICKCEFMLNNSIAKIENFDILKSYQRKGFGNSVIKHLLEEAIQHCVEFVYLITDSGDTAKGMYKKCGFKKAGEKTELFFDLI